MGGRTERAEQGGTRAGRPTHWKEVGALLLLLLLAAALRLYLFRHTEVAARDSIGFIRMAWKFQSQPWWAVLRDPTTEQHPAYPLLILAASLPVRYFMTGPDAVLMQVSAQLVSVLAGTLLVLPMYYLGRELFNRTAGFWGALLFQLLPASCRVLSDALSEATFLLFAATALYLAVRALRRPSPVVFALCGLCSALAYLTRPEGALIAAATGVVLLALQWSPQRRLAWRTVLACGGSLALAALVAGSPIYLATGKLTLKPTGNDVMGLPRSLETEAGPGAPDTGEAGRAPRPAAASTRRPQAAALLALWRIDLKGPFHKRSALWGLTALIFEIIKGTQYGAWLPALLGLWWFRGRPRLVPGACVPLLVCLALGLLLWRVATLLGYISDRHTVLLLLCGGYWAVAAVARVGELLAAWLGLWAPGLAAKAVRRALLVALLLALMLPALPRSLEPLHVNRAGFRDVGFWLAEHADLSDRILDPYSWSNYYAGRVFHDEPPDSPPRTEYVVLEDSRNAHGHLWLHQVALEHSKLGREVYHWSGRHGKERVSIRVYAVPLSPH
jgi:hypothetical protein